MKRGDSRATFTDYCTMFDITLIGQRNLAIKIIRATVISKLCESFILIWLQYIYSNTMSQ